MAHRNAVLHVLAGTPLERADVRAALTTARLTRPVLAQEPPTSDQALHVSQIAFLAARAAGNGTRLLHAHGAGGAWHAWRASMAVAGRFGISVSGRDVLVESRDDQRMRTALMRARVVVVPSQVLADAVLARRVKHERVHVIPPGVPLGAEPTPRRNDVPVVVFTGAFDEQSGVLDVAEAVKGQPVRAHFVGSGPLEHTLREYGEKVTVSDDPEQHRRALRAGDLAITAGRTTAEGHSEAWGRTAVAAQAAGLPLIATRNGGLPQWVAPDGALLVPSHGDMVRSLRWALEDLLSRPSQWQAMGAAGRAHVAEHLDVVHRTAELEQLWIELARRGPMATLRGSLTRPPDQF